jgi:hypothetical protein
MELDSERGAAPLSPEKQQQSGKRLGAMSYLAELLLNALMLFAWSWVGFGVEAAADGSASATPSGRASV